jgi:hypothetical protein
MAEHILIICVRYPGAQHELRYEQGHLHDFSKSLGTAEWLQKTIKWVMQGGIMGQFGGG